MPAVGGNNAQNVLTSTVTLTDAQIKALPTTGVQAVAAPGANRMVVVVASVWRLDATSGAYSNLTALRTELDYGATATPASTQYNESAQGAFADASAIHLLGVFLPIDAGAGAAAWFADRGTVVNAAVTVTATNSAAGNLTGGNAANTMRVTTAYQVVNI